MPGVYKPVHNFYPNGVVSIETTDQTDSYKSIQQSFVSYYYRLVNYYCRADNQQQLTQPLSFQRRDANGNKIGYPLIITVSPNQFQNCVLYDFSKQNVVFNGQYFYEINLLPLEQINTIFDVIESSSAFRLPNTGAFNFIFGKFKDTI